MWPKGPEAVVFRGDLLCELGKNNGFAQEKPKRAFVQRFPRLVKIDSRNKSSNNKW